MLLQRRTRAETTAALLAHELILGQLSAALLVHLEMHAERLFRDESVTAQIALSDILGDDYVGSLDLRHVQMISDQQLLRLFLIEYLGRLALLLVLR